MTKIQLIATLVSLVVMAFLGACSSDDYLETDVYKVTPELRARINRGMKMVSRSEKNAFNERFALFLDRCDSMADVVPPYQYLETEEYKDLKNYILSASPSVYYLLMDKYLKKNPHFIPFILNDLVETAYPSTVDKIAFRMKSSTTVLESMEFYPQVCLETWLDSLENQ